MVTCEGIEPSLYQGKWYVLAVRRTGHGDSDWILTSNPPLNRADLLHSTTETFGGRTENRTQIDALQTHCNSRYTIPPLAVYPGLEPGISSVTGRRDNHFTNKPCDADTSLDATEPYSTLRRLVLL